MNSALFVTPLIGMLCILVFNNFEPKNYPRPKKWNAGKFSINRYSEDYLFQRPASL